MPLNPLDEFSPPRYRSAGRRPEANNDRTASANAPLSALRGYAAGTAGLFGDIEGLLRSGLSQLPPQLLTTFPALRAFGIGSHANPTPQLPTTEFYNEYLPGAQLNQTPTGKAFTTAGNVLGGTGSTTIARLGIKSTAELADLAARIAAESPRAGSRAAQLGVIKMPGGNFLKGGIEDAVRPMKRGFRRPTEVGGEPVTDEMWADYLKTSPDSILNTFIDKKIVPYIKNEMATPGDPLRAMAEKYAVDKPAKLAEVQGRIDAFAAKMEQTARERGVPVGDLTSMRQQMIGLEKEKALVEAREGLHFTPDEEQHAIGYYNRRVKAGTDLSGMGQSPLAKSWENVTDSALGIDTAGNLLKTKDWAPELVASAENPWLSKVPPETKVYSARSMLPERTGFDHLVDELRNATNPESGLPKNLLIDPADLSKLTMAQAVELVADINAWRATQKAEADLLRANNAATQVVKEYPEQGMKWVELKAPEELSGGVTLEPKAGGFDIVGPNGEDIGWAKTKQEAIRISGQDKTLEDALKYEGDTMAHCVGGYCPDVVEGKSRIYSLRDDKGQPRVTIEVKPQRIQDFTANTPDPDNPARTLRDRINQVRTGNGDFEEVGKRVLNELGIERAMKIIQIKGFKNQKPADEFLPFVQDFVKSGKWSHVDDLQNTGLDPITTQLTSPQIDYLRKAGVEVPDYGTPDQNKALYEDLVSRFRAEGIIKPKPEPGFAQGGLVSNHFDPIKIKQIIASLDDDYDPQRIQQIIAHQESSYA